MSLTVDETILTTEEPATETPVEPVVAIDPKAVAPPLPQRTCRLPNGLEVGCQSVKETEHIYDDIFAHRVYLSNGITLWDGATVFDVGGNIGMFTVFLHHHFRDIRSYTFEPAPPLFDILHHNAALHGGEHAKLYRCGVSDRRGTANLTFYPYSSGMSSFYGDEEEEKDVLRVILANQEKGGDAEADGLATSEEFLDARFTRVDFECPLVPLAEIIRQEGVDHVDLLKIDVQKSELDVLRGLGEDDWPKVRQIAIEVHDLDGQLEVVTRLLEEKGFGVVTVQDPLYAGSVMYNLYAVRKGLYRELSRAGETSTDKPATRSRKPTGKQAFARFRKPRKS